MSYLDILIPKKYIGEHFEFSIKKKRRLVKRITRKAKHLLDRVLSVDVDSLDEDIEILNKELFGESGSEYVYNKYDIHPVGSDRMSEILCNLNFHKYTYLLTTVKILSEYRIYFDRLSLHNQYKFQNILWRYNIIESNFTKICTNKNFPEILSEHKILVKRVMETLTTYLNCIVNPVLAIKL